MNTICPGLVPTEINLKRFGKLEDIANGTIYLLSDASSWVSDNNLVIDGGYTIV